MEINFKTEFNTGTELYFLKDNRIEKTIIRGIRCVFREGTYAQNNPNQEIMYSIAGEGICKSSSYIKNHYFMSKADVLKHIAEQI